MADLTLREKFNKDNFVIEKLDNLINWEYVAERFNNAKETLCNAKVKSTFIHAKTQL